MKNVPYWIEHAYMAVVLSIPFIAFVDGYSSFFMGSMFYLGREITDVEKKYDWNFKKFDWKGLLAPLAANTLLLFVFEIYGG